MSQNLPLSGLNVLEQCGWNGILTGRLLAEAGAKVIRAYPKNQDPLEKEAPLLFGDFLIEDLSDGTQIAYPKYSKV